MITASVLDILLFFLKFCFLLNCSWRNQLSYCKAILWKCTHSEWSWKSIFWGLPTAMRQSSKADTSDEIKSLNHSWSTSSWVSSRQSYPANSLPGSWPTENDEVINICCFPPLSLGVICDTSINNYYNIVCVSFPFVLKFVQLYFGDWEWDC
jgi:hypothetical protein